jgi:hypothetical protein
MLLVSPKTLTSGKALSQSVDMNTLSNFANTIFFVIGPSKSSIGGVNLY